MVNKTETPLYTSSTSGPEDPTYWANDPNKQLGFEVAPVDVDWSFAPEFYPKDFTSSKQRKLDRYGGNCGGESVSIKKIKNREFHARGLMTTNGLAVFNHLMDYNDVVTLYSPLIPAGGMNCYIKKAERGNEQGVDPLTRQRLFEYTLDLVSTGEDEYSTGKNGIVTAIVKS